MRRTLMLVLFLARVSNSAAASRTVDVRQDLCARMPNLSSCRSQETVQNDAVSALDVRRAAATAVVSSADRTAYCKQYQPHYTYHCSGNGKSPDDEQAAQFCRSYTNNCDVNAAPDASALASMAERASPAQVAQKCQQYRTLAAGYCTGNEPQAVKQYCDAYRRYCVERAAAPTAGSAQALAVSPVTAAAAPPATPAKLDPEQREKLDYCGRYRGNFDDYCRGKQPSGRLGTFCNAYKDYCSDLSQQSGGGGGGGGGSSVTSGRADKSVVNFDSLPLSANYNNSRTVRRICDENRLLNEAHCPGYEALEMREYCNKYRVYCLGKDPFPTIDGSLGFNKDNWGVAGIPYYPFNPQGAIAGGERNTVGFGDWGANFQQRSGVSDFFDRQKEVDANWQKGDYGYSDGWNVPLLGIGGFKRTAVNMGGLLNPSDYPSLASGGAFPQTGLGALGGLGGLFG